MRGFLLIGIMMVLGAIFPDFSYGDGMNKVFAYAISIGFVMDVTEVLKK